MARDSIVSVCSCGVDCALQQALTALQDEEPFDGLV